MLLLAVLAALPTPSPPVPSQAQATVRIVRGAQVTKQEWEGLPLSRKRETLVVESGRRIIVRVVEFE
ncbi:MAG: hypothetical protein HOP96_09465 [Sphingomonas sp.]|nr:hypothetical protein [Sphingomonas sp.]